MWTIRILDGTTYIIYLREYLLDGGILYFEHEELALRFLRQIQSQIRSLLDVRLTVAKYEGDRRKDVFCKVNSNNWDMFCDAISQYGR